MVQANEHITTDNEQENTLINRAELWASTMGGREDGSVIHAHSESILYIPFDGPTSIDVVHEQLLNIDARFSQERFIFSPSATFSSGSENRARATNAVDPYDIRTRFEHDRDRILHSSAFRRLAGKTQVHLNPDDHQRTRLTHALEVAQIAKAIARALRLNDTLAEAIALGHDCGHGPGGHASEDAFDPYLVGGFNHASFGANVTLRRLNLCAETLDGIRNHSWSLETPFTPEAEVVSFADRIAYVCHDAEDALSCGIISPSDFPDDIADFLSLSRGAQIDHFVKGVLQGTLLSESIAMTKECGEILGAIAVLIMSTSIKTRFRKSRMLTLSCFCLRWLIITFITSVIYQNSIDWEFPNLIQTK